MPRRLAAIVTVTAAVVVFAGVLYVFLQHDPVPGAGSTPGYPAPAVAATSGPGGGPDSAGATRSGTRVRLVFLGDDYTAGVGGHGHGFAGPVADRLDARQTTVAAAGAGYAKPGTDGHSYLGLEPRVVADRPDVVVVSGGRNDLDDAPATLRADAARLFARLHRDLPAATLVAVAPWWGDSPHPADLRTVDDAVRAGVGAAGGAYLRLADPLRGHPSWMANDADPDAQGYQAIATALAAALRPLLPTP